MIFRRLKAHVEKENWFAVAIDFAIVVIGVFIGLQVSTWNANRLAGLDYEAAVDRYRDEIKANIADLEALIQQTEARSETVRQGFDALLSCEETEENRRAVEEALGPASGTIGISIGLTALDELTSNPVSSGNCFPIRETRSVSFCGKLIFLNAFRLAHASWTVLSLGSVRETMRSSILAIMSTTPLAKDAGLWS